MEEGSDIFPTGDKVSLRVTGRGLNSHCSGRRLGLSYRLRDRVYHYTGSLSFREESKEKCEIVILL
jgi:hypothetical protein